jgi:hypothetical protein
MVLKAGDGDGGYIETDSGRSFGIEMFLDYANWLLCWEKKMDSRKRKWFMHQRVRHAQRAKDQNQQRDDGQTDRHTKGRRREKIER